jgi:hypothetical protein
VATGATADNFDNFDSSLALKIAWSFKIVEKLSILTFMSSRILSLATNFLERLLVISFYSSINSRGEGRLELLPVYLPA